MRAFSYAEYSHFQSRDKDGSHAVRSAIAQDLLLHANFMALCFTEPELTAAESFTLQK